MSRILITGGAGFIGSHLCESCLDRGHRVVCVDNYLTGNTGNIEPFLNNAAFSLIEHDVTQFIDVEGPIDAVLHFASPASPVDYSELPIQTLKVGSLGTHNALGLAKAKGAKFLLASTSEAYGDPLVKPQTEDYWGNVNPVGPRGVYDEAKRFAEAMTMAYYRSHGVDTRIVRIFNTFGPRMRVRDGRVVPNFITQALKDEDLTVYGDGSQTRSFLYISDLIRGIHSLLESGYHLPVNLGSSQEMSVLEFAHKILAMTGSNSKITFKALPQDDPHVRQPDTSRAKELLGWEQEVPIDVGLARTIEYFKAQLGAA